jgi:hypothetical protein
MSYETLYDAFGWHVPADFNIAEACCGRWARDTPDAGAIRWEHESGRSAVMTYAELQREANRLSHVLTRLGVARGDRVAIVMPQRFETAVAHVAIHQLGAIAMPLSILFGPDALEYRINDSGTRVAIVDESAIDNLVAARPACTGLTQVLAVGGASGRGDVDWHVALAGEPDRFEPVGTKADDGAVLIYTSGTTGPPKGALIPQRALIGNLSGFVCSQNWFGFAAPAGPLSSGEGERGKGGVGSGPWTRSAGDQVFLVARRLGVDGRPDGCAAAHALLRPHHRRLPGPLRAREGLRADAAPPRHAHLPVPHGAEGDDEGRACPARALRPGAARHHERGRIGGRRGVRVLRAAARRDGQRDVRPDRDELRRRQLRHALARAAGQHGASRTRATAWR